MEDGELIFRALVSLLLWALVGSAVGNIIKRVRKLGRAPRWPIVVFALFGLLSFTARYMRGDFAA